MIIQEDILDLPEKNYESYFPNVKSLYIDGKIDPERPEVTGMEIPDQILKKHEKNHMHYYPFDKAEYHQCIPHPIKEDQMITVQIMHSTMKIFRPEAHIKTDNPTRQNYEYLQYKLDIAYDDKGDLLDGEKEGLFENINRPGKLKEVSVNDKDEKADLNEEMIAIIGFWKKNQQEVFECFHNFTEH